MPIKIAEIDEDSIREDRRHYYKNLKKLQIMDFTDEYRGINKHDHTLQKKIDEIVEIIKSPIKNKKKNTQISNLEIFGKFDLLNFERENYKSIKNAITNAEKKYTSLPVCIIYTGGTVGMIHDKKESKHDKNDLIQGKIEDIVEYFFKLEELEVDVHFFEISPIDSSNATFSDWVNLAKLISKIYDLYQGFVILHGANTMAYAASFLSFTFENLQKPIIFTGSENPLIDIDSDADLNVLRAVQIAAHESRKTAVVTKISEVCIFYGDKLFRGNRSTKYHAFNPSKGFLSLNSPEIGVFFNNKLNLRIDPLNSKQTLEDSSNSPISTRLPNKTELNPKIVILDVYPDMPLEDYVEMFNNNNKIHGLILRTYGTGNPPDKPDLLLISIKKLMETGTIVVNTTQSPEGRVLIKLYETNATLFDLGVVNGGDMTREAVYTKLRWLLSTEPNLEGVKAKMQKNIRGELKYSSYNFIYTNLIKVSKDNLYRVTKSIDVDSDLKKVNEIDHAIIRVTKIKILDELKENKTYTLNILYNPEQTNFQQVEKEGYEDSLFASYEKVIGPKEKEFDKNIEVTFDFKQFFDSRQLAIHLGLFFDPPLKFEFENLGLYVYTKSE